MDELVDHVCARTPVLSRLVGRHAVAETVARTVASWPGSDMTACGPDEEGQRVLLRRLRKKVMAEQRYGNPLLILWGISIIINLVWQWWLSRQQNRERMTMWQQAMEAGS